MIDYRKTTDKCAVHVKYDSLWPRFILDEFFLVQITNDACLLLSTATLRLAGLTLVDGSLFVNHREILNIEVIVNLQ